MVADTQKTVRYFFFFTLAVAACFVITTWAACGTCYYVNQDTGACMVPDYQAPETFYQVNNGAGFSLVVTGFAFLAQGVLGLRTVAFGNAPAVNYGLLVGMTAMCAVLAMITAVKWGSVAHTVGGLAATIDSGAYVVHGAAYSRFAAVTVFASVEWLAYTALTGLLWSWRGDFTDTGLGGANDPYAGAKAGGDPYAVPGGADPYAAPGAVAQM